MWRFMARVGTGKIFLKEVIYRPVRQKCRFFLYIYSNKREISYGFALFVICLPTKHSESLRTCLKVSVCFRLIWNVEVLFFCGAGKLEYPEKNPSEQRRE